MENSKLKYDDQLFVKRLEDLIQSSNKKMSISFTDFLDPRQQIIIIEHLRKYKGISIDFFGGYEEAERKICGVYSEYTEFDKGKIPIDILHLSWKSHKKICHRDILGSLLGTGIRREKIGDIIQRDDEAYAFVHRDIANYLIINADKVGNVSVDIEYCHDIPPYAKEEKIISAVVASLRLDCILAAGFGVSRTKAVEAVKSSKVSVNWKPEESSSKEIEDGDVISWRGKGRIQLENVIGNTKKDRIKVNIKKYI